VARAAGRSPLRLNSAIIAEALDRSSPMSFDFGVRVVSSELLIIADPAPVSEFKSRISILTELDNGWGGGVERFESTMSILTPGDGKPLIEASESGG